MSPTDWGTTLRKQREEAKLTQDELARRLTAAGVVTAMTSVSRWETGKAVPSANRKALIERVLADIAAGRNGIYVRTTGGRAIGPGGPPVMDDLEFVYSITEGKGPFWERVVKCVADVRQDIRQAIQTASGRKHG